LDSVFDEMLMVPSWFYLRPGDKEKYGLYPEPIFEVRK
jgi:hypothetical protein